MVALNLACAVIPLGLLCNLLEIECEPLKVSVPLRALRLDQECQWEDVEWILPNEVVVLAHVQEHSFLIGQLLVLLHTVVDLDASIHAVFENTDRFVHQHRGILVEVSDDSVFMGLQTGATFLRSRG
jgi:hypothetical protein